MGLPPGGAGVRTKVRGVPIGHSSAKALAVTFTLWSKVTVMLVSAAMVVAVSVGLVVCTTGGVSLTVVKVTTLSAAI